MELGRHLRELWRLRISVGVCMAIALFVALSVSYKVHLFPPGLEGRSVEMAAASTEVLVDTPRSTLVDLRQDLFDIESMTNRAVLLGNVMASPPVLGFIARRAGVPPDVIRAQTPRTPNSPRPLATEGNERRTSDLLRSTNQYRLSIDSNPTVPVLKIYAQAPTAPAAQALANASVDGLRDYLREQALARGVDLRKQVRLVQLGRARGAVINEGVRVQVLFLVFLLVFGVAATAAISLSRVRRGWELARSEEPAQRADDEDDPEDDDDPPPATRRRRPSRLVAR